MDLTLMEIIGSSWSGCGGRGVEVDGIGCEWEWIDVVEVCGMGWLWWLA